MMRRPASLPPLWLAGSAVVSAITFAFGVARWIDHFVTDPNAEDLRLQLIAARIGLAHGWSHIYDVRLQQQAAAGLGPSGSTIDSMHLFISPPPTAWMLVPLAAQPLPVAYLVWTLISLAVFLAAGWLVLPRPWLVCVTLLFVSLAVWPVHYQFWDGQTVAATLSLVALCYWLLEKDRSVLAGVALALAFCFKPQDALLLPLALLISGRWRPVAAFAVSGALIVAASALSLGTGGIGTWLRDLSIIHGNAFNSPLTYSFIFGPSALAIGVEVALGAVALVFVWLRRERLHLLFALALVGSTMSATYLHEFDIAILVPAAWIVLRAEPSMPPRMWLLAGIVAAQFISIGQPIPMLAWEPVWMLLLGLEPHFRRLELPIMFRRPLTEPPAC